MTRLRGTPSASSIAVAASLVGTFALGGMAACGSSANGGGGAVGDGGMGADSGNGDVAATGAWGPCSLDAAGKPSAEPVEMRALDRTVSFDNTSCDGATALYQSAAEYETFLRAQGDSGDVDAGMSPPGIDWSRESLLRLATLSSSVYTAGREGDVLVLARGSFCQGITPSCDVTLYAVPKVSRIDVVGCPPPSEPCLAP